MQISEETKKAFEAHAIAEWPKEACGVIVGGKYIPCTNTSSTPTHDFKISSKELTEIKRKHGKVEAVLHTHPYHSRQTLDYPPEWPSYQDMDSWIKSKKPWGIAATCGEGITEILWLDDKVIPPLVGRQFEYGKSDCYTLIRDYFRVVKKINLPNFPRYPGFAKDGVALYDDNFAKAGFVEIRPDQVQVGDVCLMKISGKVAGHAAVITGPNEILHHISMHRLSGYDELHKWMRCITKFIRYEGDGK